MRAAGVDSLVVFLWHLSEPASNDLSNIPSAGGRIAEPFRSNLVNYVRDVRAAGFKSLTVNYGPQWTNNPYGQTFVNGVLRDIWDPGKLDENWGFIRDTRTLIKQNGPAETWFDPTMEMPPTGNGEALTQRLVQYIAEIYRRYVESFGKDDLVLTVIAKSPEVPVKTAERVDNLVRALRSTSLGMPARFGVHPDQTAPLPGIRAVDDALKRNGLEQPLVIGEVIGEGPSSGMAARDVVQFVRGAVRPIPQVHLWWWRSDLEPHECSSPPYRADSYISAFTGAPVPSTLSATVRGRTIEFRTPSGQPVSALTSGDYHVVVRDVSRTTNFHLVGPKLDRRTGLGSRDTATWAVTLRPGAYRFGSDSLPAQTRRTLIVLAAG
jgi:hypothetical protein